MTEPPVDLSHEPDFESGSLPWQVWKLPPLRMLFVEDDAAKRKAVARAISLAVKQDPEREYRIKTNISIDRKSGESPVFLLRIERLR